MTVIVIVSEKGGVGKTTLTLNLASYFSSFSKTLLTDFDGQANSTIQLTGSADHIPGLFDVMTNKIKNIGDAIKKTNWGDNLHILPGDKRLKDLESSIATLYRHSHERVFKNKMHEVFNYYDYTFIDTPPSLSLNTISALIAADYYLIPVTLNEFSIHGMTEINHLIKDLKENVNPNLKSLNIILNRVSKQRSKVVQETKKYLMNNFEILGTIRDTVIVEESQKVSTPLHKHNKNHLVSKDFKSIAEKIKDQIQ